jgi:hypothetical protein
MSSLVKNKKSVESDNIFKCCQIFFAGFWIPDAAG